MPQVKEFSSDVPFENPLEGVVIPLDGEKFECKGRLSVLQMSKLASQAITPGLAEAAEAASIYQTLALAFGETYDRFEAHVELRNTPDETILGILQYINEAVQENIERIAGRPTQPSSGSPTGLKDKADLPVRSISLSKGTVAVGDGQGAAGQGEDGEAAEGQAAADDGPPYGLTWRLFCDSAEQLYAEQLASDEQLHLLALIATGLGATGLEEYEPPSWRVADWLNEPADPAEARRDRIAEISALADGEVC